MNLKEIRIAIDGPASSGKSTVAKIIAKDFDIIYLDTGAMYRAATYVALSNELDDDFEKIITILKENPISFGTSSEGQLVYVGEVDVTHGRTGKVSREKFQQIQAALEKFNYSEQMAGRILANNGSRIIGLIIQDNIGLMDREFSNPYVGELTQAIEYHAMGCN